MGFARKIPFEDAIFPALPSGAAHLTYDPARMRSNPMTIAPSRRRPYSFDSSHESLVGFVP